MGGGKGAIDHYITPVKAERIIIEVAGKCSFEEVGRSGLCTVVDTCSTSETGLSSSMGRDTSLQIEILFPAILSKGFVSLFSYVPYLNLSQFTMMDSEC